MPYSLAIMRIHLSDLMLIRVAGILNYISPISPIGPISLRELPDIHYAVADCELERRPAGARARANRVFGDAGFLAWLKRFVSVHDLASAQHVGVDVATETRGQIDVDRAGGNANVGATATPASRRNR